MADNEDDGFVDNLSQKERGVSRPLKPTPAFKRRKGEDETTFMYRVDRETQAVIGQAQFEAKYNVSQIFNCLRCELFNREWSYILQTTWWRVQLCHCIAKYFNKSLEVHIVY